MKRLIRDTERLTIRLGKLQNMAKQKLKVVKSAASAVAEVRAGSKAPKLPTSTSTLFVNSVDKSMRVLMAQQRDVSGHDFLDLRPAIWLGPMSLGGTARVVNNSEFDPDSTTGRLQRANMVRGLVRDIVDTPRLSGTAHYMFADPADAPAFEVAFLDGNDAPFLENQSGFKVDGVAWKVRLDFGVAPRDFRGAVRNPGA